MVAGFLVTLVVYLAHVGDTQNPHPPPDGSISVPFAALGTVDPPAQTFDCSASTGSALPNLLSCPLDSATRAEVHNGSLQVVYVHIPKAGGTTAEKFLEEYLKHSRHGERPRIMMLGRSWTLLRYLGLPEGAKENVRLIASKASVSVDDQDAGRRRLMAIVLRHPVDRAVSHFR